MEKVACAGFFCLVCWVFLLLLSVVGTLDTSKSFRLC